MQKGRSEILTPSTAGTKLTEHAVPKIIAAHGEAGRWCWEEYFGGRIRNANTRKTYLHAVRNFLHWCDTEGVPLQEISPGMVGRYFDLHPGSTPTKKLHMSAIRGLFDVLVQRHVMILNPALSVRTERYSVTEGKTPEITVEQSRQLLKSIELQSAIDFRDRAIISMLVYTAARVGAVAKLRLGDLVDEGNHLMIKFREKGGKDRSIPARISLREELDEYLVMLPINGSSKDDPVFRSAVGRTGLLTESPMSAIDICRMVKRRLKAAGLPLSASPHSFRSCTATDLLEQGISLEDVQYLLGHSDSRVTRLYDRRQRKITRNIVERISV
ncbi:tyrosine-type recombinase/integrase [Fuerstiella marisgermanici]|uniref:Tyrosine recombinase XerD n=1 Tax=Fuerstiella marisgermanici TaxID=1891926 RepID=A0A1P8WKH1_9PLAN|nr:tyrosine-type recombinase/integrase [Fuerstiella marisgermanici]APZ94543.1 Tyrosine recombinase XerD [Fuerstiella marisgermanici]